MLELARVTSFTIFILESVTIALHSHFFIIRGCETSLNWKKIIFRVLPFCASLLFEMIFLLLSSGLGLDEFNFFKVNIDQIAFDLCLHL